jgi:glycosidase
MGKPLYPSLYLVNTRVYLNERGRALGRAATLDDIPDAFLDQILAWGFDWVWFLGIWQTGPSAREVSRTNPDWQAEFREQLHDLKEEDITGSPFAVQNYTPSTDFGGKEALLRLRERLSSRGLRLMLDFVPNHTAPDHPWRFAHPEFYVRGSEDDLVRDPHGHVRLRTRNGDMVFARGRDPYFPAWADTLQLNYRHPGLRAAMIQTLKTIGELSDGVRCDMAMLVLPGIFANTWGHASWPESGVEAVDTSFWAEAVPQVREAHPGFVFMAEVYWDREWELQQEGFDYTYDKRLYDRLRAGQARVILEHLWADGEFQRRSTRFLENHDEPRAASTFPWPVHQAAAVVAFLVPGMRLFHEGQFDGRQVRASMHLGRRPEETPVPEVRAFYGRLLEVLKRPEVRDGRWQLRDCRPAWGDNPTWTNFLAYTWEGDNRRLLAVVNYSPIQSQCYIHLPSDLHGRKVTLRDLMGLTQYERHGDELISRGLYLDVAPWGYHVFEVIPG